MRRVLLLLTFLPIMVFFSARRVWPDLYPLIPVTKLIRDANLIAVGEVTDVWEDGQKEYQFNGNTESMRLFRARFHILRVLKGTAEGELSFTFLRPINVGAGFVGADKGEFGLFFFRDSDDGLVFASDYRPKIIVGHEECVTTGEPVDRIAGELACVIQSRTSAVFDRIDAMGAVAELSAPSATEVLRSASRELPSPLNLLAAIDLVACNDISALPLVEEGARTSPVLIISDKGNRMEQHWGRALAGIKDPAAIPALARMLAVDDSEIRQGAVEGLRNTDSEAALEPLSQALYDSNVWVRWDAVTSLAAITHQKEWYPFWDQFKDNEQLYLDHWKAWAIQRFSKGQ